MRIDISRLHFPVTTLGPGRRIGIWMQGCSIRCPGCISADTWAAGKGAITLSELIDRVAPWFDSADGVTISGGEPFDQPEALLALLSELRRRSPADILVFTGHARERVESVLCNAEGLIDALVSDPFDMQTPQSLALRGSDNQRLHFLTELGRQRFESYDRKIDTADRRLDLMMDEDGQFWMAGIPQREDIERLESLLATAGHKITTTQARIIEGQKASGRFGDI